MRFKMSLAILMLVVFAAACSSNKWKEGDFAGKATLVTIDAGGREQKVESDKAGFNLSGISDLDLKFDAQSLLPNCVLRARRGSDYEPGPLFINFENPPKVCRAMVSQGGVEIPMGIGEVKEQDGEVVITVNDYKADNDYPHYRYEFRGKRKGWF